MEFKKSLSCTTSSYFFLFFFNKSVIVTCNERRCTSTKVPQPLTSTPEDAALARIDEMTSSILASAASLSVNWSASTTKDTVLPRCDKRPKPLKLLQQLKALHLQELIKCLKNGRCCHYKNRWSAATSEDVALARFDEVTSSILSSAASSCWLKCLYNERHCAIVKWETSQTFKCWHLSVEKNKN